MWICFYNQTYKTPKDKWQNDDAKNAATKQSKKKIQGIVSSDNAPFT